jgi:DNA adenine methylase
MPSKEMPRPVLKWAGGKSLLAARILELLPGKIETYFEPFFGGGAIFFALARARRFRRAVVADVNPELINVYQALKDDVEAVVRRLRRKKMSEDEYYKVREQEPTKMVDRAVRTIYLNRTGYNGLYRVNSKGKFNVPFGRYENPTICDEPNLRAVANVLCDVELVVEDFESICRCAKPGDAVYLDPPYLPLPSALSFTSYDRHPFGMPEHQRLARVFDDLAQRRVAAVLSNSYTPDSKRLYESHFVEYPMVARPINSDSKKRGKIKEILVCNQRGRG